MKRALFILAAVAARADSLDAVLNRIDQASKVFQSLTSDVHRTNYSDLFSETTSEDGVFKMLKSQKKGKLNVTLLAEFQGRDARSIHVSAGEVRIYHPKARSVEIYETKRFTKSADLVILIGFGTSRAELEKGYTITLGPSETVAGVRTTRIDLKPRSKEEQNFFNSIQLWIPEDKGYPIREKVLSGKESKDYNQLDFGNLRFAAVAEKDLELNVPAGTKEIRPGK